MKKQCPKCKGKGCSHCGGKGYHSMNKVGYMYGGMAKKHNKMGHGGLACGASNPPSRPVKKMKK